MNDLDKRAKLMALWLFVFISMIFRDLHQLGHPWIHGRRPKQIWVFLTLCDATS